MEITSDCNPRLSQEVSQFSHPGFFLFSKARRFSYQPLKCILNSASLNLTSKFRQEYTPQIEKRHMSAIEVFVKTRKLFNHHQLSNFADGIWAVLAEVMGEGDGTPLRYSCLENPMDGGAW